MQYRPILFIMSCGEGGGCGSEPHGRISTGMDEDKDDEEGEEWRSIEEDADDLRVAADMQL